MDPVSALNVAAATVQFVDFSAKAVKTIIEVYHFIELKGRPSQFQHMVSNVR
jgi:hypothetical protein